MKCTWFTTHASRNRVFATVEMRIDVCTAVVRKRFHTSKGREWVHENWAVLDKGQGYTRTHEGEW